MDHDLNFKYYLSDFSHNYNEVYSPLNAESTCVSMHLQLSDCATVWEHFLVAPSLPEAMLWRLNLCIISHSALCPRSSMMPSTSWMLAATPYFQDNNSGRQTGSHNVAWLLQTTIDPELLPITRLQSVFDFRLTVSFFFFFFQRGIEYQALLFFFSKLDPIFFCSDTGWATSADHKVLQWLNQTRKSRLLWMKG